MVRFLGLIILLSIIGCGHSKRSDFNIPDPQKMSHIIAEIHLADATVSNPKFGFFANEHNRVYSGVLKKYSLTKAEFDSAVAYYSNDPTTYQKIYEDAIVILSQKEVEIIGLKEDAKVDTTKLEADSIKDLWKGDREVSFRSTESSVAKNAFFVMIEDSLPGGVLLFSANYKITPKVEKPKKSLFVVDYFDGSKDTLRFDIKGGSKFEQFEIKLKDIIVTKLSGQYIEFPIEKGVVVDIKNIRLKRVVSKRFIRLLPQRL